MTFGFARKFISRLESFLPIDGGGGGGGGGGRGGG